GCSERTRSRAIIPTPQQCSAACDLLARSASEGSSRCDKGSGQLPLSGTSPVMAALGLGRDCFRVPSHAPRICHTPGGYVTVYAKGRKASCCGAGFQPASY